MTGWTKVPAKHTAKGLVESCRRRVCRGVAGCRVQEDQLHAAPRKGFGKEHCSVQARTLKELLAGLLHWELVTPGRFVAGIFPKSIHFQVTSRKGVKWFLWIMQSIRSLAEG